MKVLALGGSIRSLKVADFFDGEAFANVRVPTDLGKIPVGPKTSNSEILAAAALAGARTVGAEVEYFPLASLFSRRESPLHDWAPESAGLDSEIVFHDTLDIAPERLEGLIARTEEAHVILLASPVYFGDRSSVMAKFFRIARERELFRGKVVAALSVGAKPHGGQETTNIFSLYEASTAGAYIVGNGPPHAQYGGTARGGDRADVLNDQGGLESAFATGARAAELGKLLLADRHATTHKIVVVVTMDTPERAVALRIAELWENARRSLPQVSLAFIELADQTIERCLACDVCPIPSLRQNDESYACIIQTPRDAMEPIRDVLRGADGIIVAGLNSRSAHLDRYQAFVERTRFIRRNDFELSHVPMTSFLLEEVGAQTNPLFGLKVLTSYLRHNGVICPPIVDIWHNGRSVVSAESGLRDFAKRTETIAARRKAGFRTSVSYRAEGYADRRLDSTQAER